MDKRPIPIDTSIIKGLIGDDEALINIFFQKFINTVPAEMSEIEQSISDQDFVTCKARAHKLKSSAKAIGAIMLADICQNIENTSLQEDQGNSNKLLAELLAEFEHCKQFINEL